MSARRLWRAVLVQAYRDFCASERDAVSVARWLGSDDFSYVCAASRVDEDKALDTFKSLARYGFPMRAKLMRETLVSTIGGQRQ